jgi:imidazolonepropionase-like amidohydrolase
MASLALINARLIDGTGKEPRDSWGLVTADDRIQEVGPSNSLRAPTGAAVIDVGGRTVMPGLIDANTHLTYHRSEFCLLLQQLTEPLEMTTIKSIENARTIIETGCTAIGDGGGRGSVAVAVREGVRQGLFPGPKVVAAGQIIGDAGGIWESLAGSQA